MGPEPLVAAASVEDELRAVGWADVRTMRQPELAAACDGRLTHEGFTLVFGEASDTRAARLA